ncbi:MAG: hypothetical protein GSR78_03620 [Desulfurococcales archaeon]|nr:hypothetical protein [Desulfurococcales archaeon]
MKESRIPPEEVSEWLWEDFGKRVPPRWDRLERAILGEKEITPQDLAVFMIDNGIQPREGAWDVVPLREGLRDDNDDS